MDGLFPHAMVQTLDAMKQARTVKPGTIALVTNIPTPYRVPLFRELDAMLRNRGYRLVVVFGGRGYDRRLFKMDPSSFGFEHRFLDGSRLQRKDVERTSFLFRGLGKELRQLRPDAVIVSGFSFAALKVLLSGRPFIVWNGSVEGEYRREGRLKRAFRKLLARQASAFVAYGTAAKSYLTGLGVKEEKVFIGINTVDTAFFSRETEKQRQVIRRSSVRRLLTVSYLTPRKEIIRLLQTALELSRLRRDFVLEIVGEGSERERLEAFVKEHGLQEQVVFSGYLQREDLPARMAAADLFLFQTGFDIWGLTVNEAMAAGLPVCCTPHAGCASDLVHEGETGFMVDYADAVSAAKKIHALLQQQEMTERIGAAAASYIGRMATLETSAQGFLRAVRHVVGNRKAE
jgi:glycosyltransferase involved in cell wall biosynthesis